jgi:hypothetical protein
MHTHADKNTNVHTHTFSHAHTLQTIRPPLCPRSTDLSLQTKTQIYTLSTFTHTHTHTYTADDPPPTLPSVYRSESAQQGAGALPPQHAGESGHAPRETAVVSALIIYMHQGKQPLCLH